MTYAEEATCNLPGCLRAAPGDQRQVRRRFHHLRFPFRPGRGGHRLLRQHPDALRRLIKSKIKAIQGNGHPHRHDRAGPRADLA